MTDQTGRRPQRERKARKSRLEILEEGLPHFEQFIESRESYIKALENTIELLRRENASASTNNLAIRSSIDELVAMQRMSNSISTAAEPRQIVSALMELTQQVIPVIDSDIFLFDGKDEHLVSLADRPSGRLHLEAEHQKEAGIVDWVIAEKKTVVIPDLEHMVSNTSSRNFVIVPLILRSRGVGVYMIHTGKPQQEFSNQDIQLLSVLANQAAVGVEHWRTYRQLAVANEEIKSSQAQMMQAAKLAAIGELAAGIAHEIKNPLSILLLHLDLAQAGKPLPNWIEMFSTQVKRLSDITLRLMNFARSVSEDVSMVPIDLNRVIEDVVAIVHHEFRGEQVEIDLQCAGSLPPVRGNANYMQQVILNLLINSRDAMAGTGGRVTIATAVAGPSVRITFADTGPGIPAELRDKIFKPFFTTKGEKGTGLGLAICSKIVAQHNGTIAVAGGAGPGTVFTITLPVWKESQPS
ncbi:MAG TPA: ATP-binding protein [Bacteroidota bacterium]|nr:ATP-binding protein [Bacteroidota bacterium]